LIISDVDQIDQCAIDILKIENTDDLKVLDHAKLAIKSMQLLTQGEYKQAYELAKSVIHMEESAGRVGIASPFDCKFVLMRCLYEFSMVEEALQQLAQLKNEAEQNGFKFIKHLCKVGEIRVLSRSPESITLISEEIESLRAELLLDPNQESMVWLVDLAEIFIKKTNMAEKINIDELKAIGCDTAKSVLEISVDDLVSRTDLEKETIEEVFRILKAEFE
jgi:hypothetical protein